MKNLTIYILLSVIVAGTASCKTNKNQASVDQEKINLKSDASAILVDEEVRAVQNDHDSLFAFIKRTPCYGRCPIYSASFYKSGYVVYKGERFVEKQGLYSTRISQDQLTSITKMARMVNYMGFEKEYDTAVTDLPTTYTSINLNGDKKEIKNRAGGPDELKNFQSHLDRILDGADWTKKGDIRQ